MIISFRTSGLLSILTPMLRSLHHFACLHTLPFPLSQCPQLAVTVVSMHCPWVVFTLFDHYWGVFAAGLGAPLRTASPCSVFPVFSAPALPTLLRPEQLRPAVCLRLLTDTGVKMTGGAGGSPAPTAHTGRQLLCDRRCDGPSTSV